MNLKVLNLNDVISSGILDCFSDALKNFRSKNNPDVENFITQNAVDFCKMKKSVTYLVFDIDSDELVGYFALTFKVMTLPLANLSNTQIRELERNGQMDEDSIQLPGLLLAQWGRNYNSNVFVSGADLMGQILRYYLKIQNLVGGVFAFLECEADKTGLLRRYEEYGYKPVSERLSREGKPLIQFIKKI